MTKSYDDLFATIQALCGISFADVEKSRIKYLINRRIYKAYRSSRFWPNYLQIGVPVTVTNAALNNAPFTSTYFDINGIGADSIIKIHKDQPYYMASSAEFDFYIQGANAIVMDGNLNPVSVYVTFQKQLSAQYGTASTVDVTYNANDVNAIDFEWFHYVAHGTYADYLRSEGQQEKAVVADGEADQILVEELVRLDEQRTTGLVGTRITTNANWQLR